MAWRWTFADLFQTNHTSNTETEMMYNYENMAAQELKEHIKAANKALKTIKSRAMEAKEAEKRRMKEQAIAELDNVAQSYGFKSAKQVFAPAKSGGPKKASVPLEPKYKDPNTGQTWTGRGRRPSWVQEWMRI